MNNLNPCTFLGLAGKSTAVSYFCDHEEDSYSWTHLAQGMIIAAGAYLGARMLQQLSDAALWQEDEPASICPQPLRDNRDSASRLTADVINATDSNTTLPHTTSLFSLYLLQKDRDRKSILSSCEKKLAEYGQLNDENMEIILKKGSDAEVLTLCIVNLANHIQLYEETRKILRDDPTKAQRCLNILLSIDLAPFSSPALVGGSG